MSRLDDRLTRELERAARPANPAGTFERVDRKRAHRGRLRKVQALALAVVVIAGTIGGVAILSKAFKNGPRGVGSGPQITNGSIVYSQVRRSQRLWVVQPDGTGAHQLTTGEGSSDLSPSISPDGKTVAFTRTEPSGVAIYTIGIDGTGLTRLTDIQGADPAWSPDGSQIAFVGRVGGVYVMSAEDGNAHLIVDRSVVAVHPTWSPDGTRIAYAAPSDAVGSLHDFDIWITDIAGVEQTNITHTTSAGELAPAWSPDGSRILFSRSTPSGSMLMTIAPDPNVSPTAITDGSGVADQSPAWSPDGQFIVFDRDAAGETDIYTMRADGSDLTVLATYAVTPAWQPIPTSSSAQPSTSATSSPGLVDIGLGFPVCNVESLNDDFNDDGIVDTAWTATKAPDVGPCPTFDGSFTVVAVDVTGDGVADGSAGPLEHRLACHPFAATDLDGDGISELVVVTQSGSVTEYTLFSIHPERADTGQALEPISVAPPGDPDAGFRAGEPFTFWAGGDEGYASYVQCADDRPDLLITQTSHPVEGPGSGVRRIQYTELRLVDGQMQVIGRNDSTEPITEPFNGAWTEPACGVDFYP